MGLGNVHLRTSEKILLGNSEQFRRDLGHLIDTVIRQDAWKGIRANDIEEEVHEIIVLGSWPREHSALDEKVLKQIEEEIVPEENLNPFGIGCFIKFG